MQSKTGGQRARQAERQDRRKGKTGGTGQTRQTLETCVDMYYPLPYPPGRPGPGLSQSIIEQKMILNVFLEILQGHENPSNPNISQLHGGARPKKRRKLKYDG